MSRKKLLKSDKRGEFTPVTLGDRINYIIALEGISGAAFCREIKISTGNLYDYINDKVKPSADVLTRILVKFKHYNANWLLTGEGAPYPHADSGVSGVDDGHIQKAISILQSNTTFAIALRQNIDAFFHCTQIEGRLNSVEDKLRKLTENKKKRVI